MEDHLPLPLHSFNSSFDSSILSKNGSSFDQEYKENELSFTSVLDTPTRNPVAKRYDINLDDCSFIHFGYVSYIINVYKLC